MRLEKNYWVTTETAAKFLAEYIESASKRWFWSGRYREKQLPEPKLIGGRLHWPLRGLEQYVLARGLTKRTDL